MKTLKLFIIAVAAAGLAGCAFDGIGDESLTAAPAPVPSPAPAAVDVPEASAATTTTPATAPVTPAPAKPRDTAQAYGPHIDASAFLNALVESGCQIDKAEYKEVKRGGAIKVVCSRTVDPLSVDLDDL